VGQGGRGRKSGIFDTRYDSNYSVAQTLIKAEGGTFVVDNKQIYQLVNVPLSQMITTANGTNNIYTYIYTNNIYYRKPMKKKKYVKFINIH